ncbi:hypothetical protein EV175_001334 [Coemansia sp. RSA 1933]|nr:hypothetical protein EV175_001334 [Coemansia sp. RSA 1933]
MRLFNTAWMVALYTMWKVSLGDTSDYDNFMSSLSYNWQDEFSDLRYQVDQLQKTDPLKYQQLAAQLGLKPGAQIDVPSQYNAVWASKFVMGAGLYTPPAPSIDPAQATPTGSASVAVTAVTTGSPTTTAGEQSVEISTRSDGSVVTIEHSSSMETEDADNGLDSTTSVFEQDGNPIVGSLNTDFNPIAPTGTGYSGAPRICSIGAIHGTMAVAALASLLVF